MPIINLEDYICNGGMCNTVIDDTNIYRDGGHLSHDGSELIGKNNDIFGKVINAANKYAAQ